MSAHESNVTVKVMQWVSIADDDLRYARYGLGMPEHPPYRLIAYHSQQCVEKYLKAYLVMKNMDFPYTHNIALLLELCADSADWTERVKDAEELSVFAISVRYPGNDEDVSREEALRAIDSAMKVRDTVRSALRHEGLALSE